MSADPSLTTCRVLWRSLVIGATALFVAWHIAAPPAPRTPPNDRAALPPVPPEKPGVP
jgi:hypothetical protein